MAGTDRHLVETKLAQIARFLEELSRVLAGSYKEFSADFRNVRTAERDIEIMVEVAADVTAHILTTRNMPPPGSYKETFLHAARERILPMELSEKLIELSSLRNRLVHEYEEEFDPVKAYKGFRTAPGVFRAFAETIFALLPPAEPK